LPDPVSAIPMMSRPPASTGQHCNTLTASDHVLRHNRMVK
jgi:hypothetical protein